MKFGVNHFPLFELRSRCILDDSTRCQASGHVPMARDAADLENSDAVIVPWGFAYGDYLRTGAIAKFSPVMESVRKFAAGGGLVLGICNGFQILCESGLLPGALMRNVGLKYVCKPVQVRGRKRRDSFYQHVLERRSVDHPDRPLMEGNYFCDPTTLEELRRDKRVSIPAMRRPRVRSLLPANPNGSLENIAGICSPGGQSVLGA